jgi:hypothetical protein
MAEDLRAALESAIEGESNETPTDSTTTDTPSPDAGDGVADDSSEPNDEHPAGSEPAEEATQPDNKTSIEQVTKAKVEEHQDDPLAKAPQSWKGGAKALWKDLPLPVRLEVDRRERDTNRVLQESSLNNRKVAEITQVLAPHTDFIRQNYGGNPMVAIQNLFQAEQALTRAAPQDRAKFVADMITTYGVDISMLDEILSGQTQQPSRQQNSNIEQLLDQRLRPIMTFVERQEQAARQQAERAEQEMNTTIDSMLADDETYPHFETVRSDMALIIEDGARKGVYIDLPAAYNKAVRMNDLAPTTGGATDAALRAHQEAQKAKGASKSVSGAPGGINGASRVNPNDLRGTIDALMSGGGGRL